MIGLARAVLFTALVGLAGSAASSETAHAEGSGQMALIAQIFNALVLAGVLVYFVRKPLQSFFRSRSQALSSEIERAEARVREARTELDGWKQRLDAFEEEARRIVDTTLELTRAERDQLVERAHAAAVRIREEAESVADREIERARGELRAEAAALATELAAELLRGALTPEDDRRLLAEFAERVRTNDGPMQ